MKKKVMAIVAKTLLSVIILFVGIIGSTIVFQFLPGDLELYLLATPIGLALAAWLMYMWFERKRGWPIGWKDQKWAGRLLTGGTTAAVIISASTSLILLTGTVELGLNTWGWGVISFQVLLFLAVAVSEEWLFRGYLYGIYQNALGTRFAIILNSVLFTAIHLFNPGGVSRPIEHIALEMINIFLMGVLMSQARAFTGTLWLPISLHFMLNFFQSTVFGFLNGGKAVESISSLHYVQENVWNGAGYGLESSLLFTPMLLLAVVVYGYLGRRSAMVQGNVIEK